MSARLPSQPPMISGFTYVRPLGSGGFADVFLYRQNLPTREVAVKVFLQGIVNVDVAQSFVQEVNTMAQLAAHPSVLTVLDARVAPDGRPIMIMDLCSEGFGKSWRTKPLEVFDVLEVGVKLASALETVHRLGKLHRDIKPSNILLTRFNEPVLADFGIAAGLSTRQNSELLAMSVPWSAPEVINLETSGTVASEIWSLGATLYSLLAGRTPFEVDDQSKNDRESISGRIQKAIYTPIPRPGIPRVIEEVLLKSMAKNPADRYGSMQEFAMELNDVQAHLGFRATQMQILGNNADVWHQGSSLPATVIDTGSVVAVESERRRTKGVTPPPSSNLEVGSAPRKRKKLSPVMIALLGAVGLGFVVTLIVLKIRGDI